MARANVRLAINWACGSAAGGGQALCSEVIRRIAKVLSPARLSDALSYTASHHNLKA